MTADLEAVAVGPDVVGVVDHPGSEPQHLLLEGAERGETNHRIGLGGGRGGRDDM
jgi:hypothetical protein